jgi:hypothetical protein
MKSNMEFCGTERNSFDGNKKTQMEQRFSAGTDVET